MVFLSISHPFFVPYLSVETYSPSSTPKNAAFLHRKPLSLIPYPAFHCFQLSRMISREYLFHVFMTVWVYGKLCSRHTQTSHMAELFLPIFVVIGCITENLPAAPNNSSLCGCQQVSDFHLPIPCFFYWRSVIVSGFSRGFRVFLPVNFLICPSHHAFAQFIHQLARHLLQIPVLFSDDAVHKGKKEPLP